MEVFRISIEKFASKIFASGSANRWNAKGQFVIYTSSSSSLSTLELVVSRNVVSSSVNYKVMVISIADDDRLIKQIFTKDLPANWRSMDGYASLQTIGSSWYNSQESLVLKVPSAIIPSEFNFVINTEHPDFKKYIKLIRLEDYFWDERLV
jgi:RES domain-containing protein